MAKIRTAKLIASAKSLTNKRSSYSKSCSTLNSGGYPSYGSITTSSGLDSPKGRRIFIGTYIQPLNPLTVKNGTKCYMGALSATPGGPAVTVPIMTGDQRRFEFNAIYQGANQALEDYMYTEGGRVCRCYYWDCKKKKAIRCEDSDESDFEFVSESESESEFESESESESGLTTN